MPLIDLKKPGPADPAAALCCPGARRFLSAVIVLACCMLDPSLGCAQAWVPAKGEGSVSLSFQQVDAAGHFLEDGSRLPGYQTRASNMISRLEYGVTDRLALSVTLPYMNSKYTGKEEPLNLPDNVLDDGTYHGAFQDLSVELRYNALRRPFVATPFFAATIPSHGYDTLGEAAVGPHLRQYLAGVYAGRLLNPVLRHAYVHGLYSYAFVERDVNIPLDRSNLDLEVGYFVTPGVSLSFLWKRQWIHGGLDFAELFEAPPDIFRNLDRVTRQNFQHVGAGAGFPLTRSMSVHVNVIKFVSGVNAHYGTGITAGVSWSFQTRGERPANSSQAPVQQAGFLRNAVVSSLQ